MMKVFRLLALGFAIMLAPAAATTATAQDPVPAGEESEGHGPVPGYLVTGLLAGLAIFFLCKSARR